VPSQETERANRVKRNDVRVIARKALLQLLEPLAGFVLDSGLSTLELQSIYREAAVRSVAAKQAEFGRRINISGIAASTGIPRAEISRILQSADKPHVYMADLKQKSTNRILAVWHQDPKFTDSNGQPADLRIYGRGITFETLVRGYGRGIPTRAMLDELARAGAVEVLSSQRVRAKTSVAVDRGVSPRAIRAFGDRAAELLSTMLLNMRYPDRARFIASVTGATVSQKALPLIRKELSNKGADFLADIQDSLLGVSNRTRGKHGDGPAHRMSVTVFLHEESHKKENKNTSASVRRNFRRDL